MFRRTFVFFALLGVLFNLDAQISIGGYSLSRAVAPPLRASIGTVWTSGFLEEVGGVAFQQTAHPAPSLAVESIQLRYEPGNPDGQRVVAIINGQAVLVNVYDWQLQPVARFADSKDHAVFTLFGKLVDSDHEDAVLKKKWGRVVNYQPDFQNTLLGLRMLQLDNLLASSAGDDLAVELPQEQGRDILAPGEFRPDPARNRVAIERYRTAVSKNLTESTADFRSYVVGDTGRDVRFDIESGALHITGEPGYYFWRYNGDLPEILDQVEKSVEKRIELAEDAAQKSQGSNFNEKSWLLQQISGVARSQGHPISAEALQEFRETDSADLALELFERRVESTLDQPAYKKVEPMTELNNFVNARLAMVKDINPIVWNAATATMRYTAFFRFCKAQNPSNWEEFLGRVNRVRIEPVVETPTVLEIAQAR